MAFAMSRVIENVVVVVVVITRDGSLGSGPRFDWENFSDARFCAASSLQRRVRASERDRERQDYTRCERVRKGLEKLLVRTEFERYDEGGKEVKSILKMGLEYGEKCSEDCGHLEERPASLCGLHHMGRSGGAIVVGGHRKSEGQEEKIENGLVFTDSERQKEDRGWEYRWIRCPSQLGH